MGKTHIAWANEVWNPVVGCTRLSEGCDKCYAFALHDRRHVAWKRGRWPAAPEQYHLPFSHVTLHPERLDEPLHWRKPRRVFVNSVSDTFHEQITDDFLDQIWQVMYQTPEHTYMLLTKRPERMRALAQRQCDRKVKYAEGFDRCPTEAMRNSPAAKMARAEAMHPEPNIWLGTSIENDLWVGRADILRQTPAAVRFISAEPLLGPLPSLDLTGIDWLIIGGESGPHARPMDPQWVRDLIALAHMNGTAVFVKQMGGLRPGGPIPDEFNIREYPR